MSTSDVYTGELKFTGDDPYEAYLWRAYVYRNTRRIDMYYTDVRIFALVWLRWKVWRDKALQRKKAQLRSKAQKDIQL